MKQGRTLSELSAELERQDGGKRDYLVPARQLGVSAGGGREALSIRFPDGRAEALPLRETAHAQLAAAIDIPKGYYDRLRAEAPALYAENVGHWLARSGRRHLVRALGGECRAVLSDRYRRLDHRPLFAAVLPVLEARGFEVVSAEVTERRLYLKAVSPRVAGEVAPGDVVQAGVAITNSEIGEGTLRIDPFAHFLACTNGLTFEDARMRRYHVGRRAAEADFPQEFLGDEARAAEDLAFWLSVRDVLAGVLSEAFLERKLERMRAALGEGVSAPPEKVVEVTARRFRLSGDEEAAVLRHFLLGHNGRAELNRYGLVQAVTRASADVPDYDRASELEQLGGRLLDLPAREWRPIAEARA